MAAVTAVAWTAKHVWRRHDRKGACAHRSTDRLMIWGPTMAIAYAQTGGDVATSPNQRRTHNPTSAMGPTA